MNDEEYYKGVNDFQDVVVSIYRAMQAAASEKLKDIPDKTDQWVLYSRALNIMFALHYKMSLEISESLINDGEPNP